MKNNDDLLSVQKNVYILVDSDGYIVREDINGERKKYPFKDEDTKYQAGNGLSLNDTTFSIDESVVATKNEVKSNKNNVKVAEAVISGDFALAYEPQYNIFINEISLVSGELDIEPIDFTANQLNDGEVATFENWITFSNNESAETISINENIIIMGYMPETLNGNFTHVFVRRIYKDSSSNIHETINYAYSF